MKRESIYKRYQPGVAPLEKNSPAYWFIFNSDKLLIDLNSGNKLPFIENLEEISIFPVRTQYLGTLEGHPSYAAEVTPGTNVPDGMVFQDLISLYEVLDEDIYLLAGRAIQIMTWDNDHQFCGRCGSPTQNAEHEMAKICPKCGFMSFPRLSPAVIIAIVNHGKILMAKHSYGLKDRYSLIAGFIEPGETIEEGVQREIMEEVGIKVKNIKYFGSQPWPFPHSLMIGFTVEYESGEIQVDGKEILDAKWFSRDEVLPRTPKISIASELIDWYMETFKL